MMSVKVVKANERKESEGKWRVARNERVSKQPMRNERCTIAKCGEMIMDETNMIKTTGGSRLSETNIQTVCDRGDESIKNRRIRIGKRIKGIGEEERKNEREKLDQKRQNKES